jgi:hypothetical protein
MGIFESIGLMVFMLMVFVCFLGGRATDVLIPVMRIATDLFGAFLNLSVTLIGAGIHAGTRMIDLKKQSPQHWKSPQGPTPPRW